MCKKPRIRDQESKCVCPPDAYEVKVIDKMGKPRRSCKCKDKTKGFNKEGKCVPKPHDCTSPFIRDKDGHCVCPAESRKVQAIDKRGKKKWTCKCEDPKKLLKDGKCVPKPNSCNRPFIRNKAGKCVCPAETKKVQVTDKHGKVSTCKCKDKNKMLNDEGKCVSKPVLPCKSPFVANKAGNRCVCPPETKEVKVKNKKTGKVNVVCECIDKNKKLNSQGKCVANDDPVVNCKSPFIRNDAGKCVCPPDTKEVKSKSWFGKVKVTCECIDEKKKLNSQGKCVANDDPVVTCKSPFIRNKAGNCVCPPETIELKSKDSRGEKKNVQMQGQE